MLIVSGAEMGFLDREASRRYRVPSLSLMEHAGRGVADWVDRRYWDRRESGGTAFVLCGLGKNGGDGLVAARYLAEAGWKVAVVLIGDPRQLKGDALKNYKRMAGSKAVALTVFCSPSGWKEAAPAVRAPDLVIDALFGTGLSRPLEGVYREIVRWANANRRRVPIVSVDLPSGISSDTGRVWGVAMRADSTVTFAFPKFGHVLYPGCEHAGTLEVVDIGIPPLLIKQAALKSRVLEAGEMRRLLHPRPKDSHKGSYGHALVIGGELGKIGAGLLAAKAFLRAGGGLASFALPEASYKRIDPHFLELMYLPIKTQTPYLDPAATEVVLENLADRAVCILGPGLGNHSATQAFVRGVLEKAHLPIVLDADGLNCVARDLSLLDRHRGRLVLTPHPGEMARLTGKKIAQVQEDRVAIARQFAEKHGVYLVLKGYRSLVATPQGEIFVNLTGNPGMATAGMGDVLSGIVASFIAQGLHTKHAVCLAVFIHGLCGDLLAKERGERGLLAHDVIDLLPSAIARFSEGRL